MRYVRPAIALTTAVVLTVGCSATSGDGSAGAPASRRDLITRAELDEVEVTNAYDAIQRLRSPWLRTRGQASTRGATSIQVYIDGVRAGDLERLRTIPIERIREIRRVSASDATIRWGTGHTAGAIEIITRA